MIAHRTIMRNIGEAVCASADVLAYCRTNFGRGLAVHIGAYPDGVPGVDDSPFLGIQPHEESEAEKTDETFSVLLTVGGCVKGPDGEGVINNVVTERTAEANGLVVNGGNKIVRIQSPDLKYHQVYIQNGGNRLIDYWSQKPSGFDSIESVLAAN